MVTLLLSKSSTCREANATGRSGKAALTVTGCVPSATRSSMPTISKGADVSPAEIVTVSGTTTSFVSLEVRVTTTVLVAADPRKTVPETISPSTARAGTITAATGPQPLAVLKSLDTKS